MTDITITFNKPSRVNGEKKQIKTNPADVAETHGPSENGTAHDSIPILHEKYLTNPNDL